MTLNTNNNTTIVLIRNDLRLSDNPALYNAVERGRIILLYVHENHDKYWARGGASRWWLHHSLEKFQQQVIHLGGQLILLKGDTYKAIEQLVKTSGAIRVFWNRRYEPAHIQQDSAIKSQLTTKGISVTSFKASLLSEPWETLNQQNLPYRVFTAYWRNCLHNLSVSKPLPSIHQAEFHHLNNTQTLSLDELQLLDKKHQWTQGFENNWTPGEGAARVKWLSFLDSSIDTYKKNRDLPNISGTSRLSPHLAFGEISPRQIWHDIHSYRETSTNTDVATYLSEIGWREFSYYLLYHFPHIINASFNPKFKYFNWRSDISTKLKAWQTGQTGYPLIDAGMRELWHTGYMHNRVRMVAASFLCKHLLIHWKHGANWFWDTLLDADLASNTASWQWVAGCGADAAPYFRIFNPVTQGEKFDTQGEYTRHWVPELKQLPNKYLHHPWDAPKEILSSANLTLGKTYPLPMVDHRAAREIALQSYNELKLLK